MIALLAIAGFEFYAGVELVGDPAGLGAIDILAYVVIADLAGAIARAWALLGLRDTSLLSSLRVLARGDDSARSEEGESHSLVGTGLSASNGRQPSPDPPDGQEGWAER